MAKAKKGKLTIEDALVPVDEQPYEIPENWCWTYLSSVADWGSGGTPSRKNPDYYEGDIPWIKTGELEDGYIFDSEEKITEDAIAHSSAKLFPIDSVLIAMYGATIGKTAILGIPATTNQACACARCNDALSNKYLFYYLRSQKDSFIAKGKGGAQPNISQDIIKGHPIPLPLLAEQERIVKQIENLFSKLDEAKEKAQESLDGFQTRIDSILHKAFSGDLSVVWRNENGISSVRGTVVFRDILDVRDGTHDSPQYYDEGYPLVTSKNLKNGCITDKDIKYISKEDFDQINQRSKVDVGDILFAMIGTIGNPVVIEDEPNYAIKNVALFKNKGKVNPYYIKYYLESREVRDKMQKEAKGTTQKFVSLGYLRDFPIAIPSDLEQKYIVKKLDELLSKELQAVSIIEEVIEQIELMKKSILAKAFRGELGTNIEDEESSIELLKKTLNDGL